jgi:hypothetical protein
MNAKGVASCSSRLKAIVAFTVRTAILSARLFRKAGPVAHSSDSTTANGRLRPFILGKIQQDQRRLAVKVD